MRTFMQSICKSPPTAITSFLMSTAALTKSPKRFSAIFLSSARVMGSLIITISMMKRYHIRLTFAHALITKDTRRFGMTTMTTPVSIQLTWHDLYRMLDKHCRVKYQKVLDIHPRIIHGIMMHIPNEPVSMGLDPDEVFSGADAEKMFDDIINLVEELRRVELLDSIFRIMWHEGGAIRAILIGDQKHIARLREQY